MWKNKSKWARGVQVGVGVGVGVEMGVDTAVGLCFTAIFPFLGYSKYSQ